jgi:hypothetical protein
VTLNCTQVGTFAVNVVADFIREDGTGVPAEQSINNQASVQVECNATSTPTPTPNVKPDCLKGVGEPLPGAGCTQYNGRLTFEVNYESAPDLNCSGFGEISVHHGAKQPDGSFSISIFFMKFASTCQPKDGSDPLSETVHLDLENSQAPGQCTQRLEGNVLIFDCTLSAGVLIETTTFGTFPTVLNLTCKGLTPVSNCSAAGPLQIAPGVTVKNVVITVVPKPVGGLFTDLVPGGSSGGSAGSLAGVIAGATAVAMTLGGAAWYARRRSPK